MMCSQGRDLVALASAAAIALARGKSEDEVSLLASFLTTIGDNLALMADAMASRESDKS